MDFIICCTDCGRPVATTDDSDEPEVTCACCGSSLAYKVHRQRLIIRLKKYSEFLFPSEIAEFKICCPKCGRHIATSEDGTKTTTSCQKCGTELQYEIKGDTAYIRMIKPKGALSSVK